MVGGFSPRESLQRKASMRLLRFAINYAMPVLPASATYTALMGSTCAACPLATACPLRLAPLAILYVVFVCLFKGTTARIKNVLKLGKHNTSKLLSLILLLFIATSTIIAFSSSGPDKLIVEPTSVQVSPGDTVKIHIEMRFAHVQPCPAAKHWFVKINTTGGVELLGKDTYRYEDFNMINNRRGEIFIEVKANSDGMVIITYHYSSKCPFNPGGIESATVSISTTGAPGGVTPAPGKPAVRVNLESIYNARTAFYYVLLVIGLAVVPGTVYSLQRGKQQALIKFRSRKAEIMSMNGSKTEALEKALIDAIGERASKNRMLTSFINTSRWVLIAAVVILLIIIPFVHIGQICPCPLWIPQALPLVKSIASSVLDVVVTVIIVSIIASIIFRRAWCGWICPLGLTQDLLSKVYGKIKIEGGLDNALRYVKYVFLIVLILIVLAKSTTWLCSNCFIAIPLAAIRYNLFTGGALFWTLTIIGLALFVLSILVPRFFCRYICPAGAFLDGLGLVSPLRVYKTDRCKDCSRCIAMDKCPMGLQEPGDTECISCMQCTYNCPFKAIDTGVAWSSSRRG